MHYTLFLLLESIQNLLENCDLFVSISGTYLTVLKLIFKLLSELLQSLIFGFLVFDVQRRLRHYVAVTEDCFPICYIQVIAFARGSRLNYHVLGATKSLIHFSNLSFFSSEALFGLMF